MTCLTPLEVKTRREQLRSKFPSLERPPSLSLREAFVFPREGNPVAVVVVGRCPQWSTALLLFTQGKMQARKDGHRVPTYP